ncbi:MAG: prenyltransferase/squalene oxidase repeat-containing protein [Pirellulales bacterium]
MPVGESDFPGKGKRPHPAGSRPLAAASAGGGAASKRPVAAGASNRPILLKPRSEGDLPDADDDVEDEEETDLKEVLRNAPAWLVSTVFHMLLLIVLGLLAVGTRNQQAELAVEVSYADQLGDQLEDPKALEGTTEFESPPQEQIITPQDLPPVDDPLASPLTMADLQLGTTGPAPITGPVAIEGAPIGLALKGRQFGSRNVLLGKYGGTALTEDAVEAGLKWLVKQQKPDGTWSLSGPYVDGSTSENVPAATAMALLAFQGHGDTHRGGQYSKVVSRGWSALLKLQEKDGLFSGAMTQKNQMLYAHAQCAIALCELYGMTLDSRFRGPAERAIAYAVQAQDKTYGGWRYEPGKDSDTSVTGWFVMALQSARMAGLKVPDEVLARVNEYLDSAALDDGRRYGYWRMAQPSNAVSAEGLLCRQYLGWPQTDPRLIEGISELVQKSPISYEMGHEQDVYYWYYATQVAHHMEGQIWNDWNKVMRELVPAKQLKKGPEAGSWDPLQDKWASFNGRLYMTCLSIYMLEVYYRHLPLYSGYQAINALPPVPAAKPSADGDQKPEPDKPANIEAAPE